MNTLSLPENLDIDFLLLGFERIFESEHHGPILRVLAIIYKHSFVFEGELRKKLFAEFLFPKFFFKLFFSWNFTICNVFCQLLVYKTLRLSPTYFDKSKHAKIVSMAKDMTSGLTEEKKKIFKEDQFLFHLRDKYLKKAKDVGGGHFPAHLAVYIRRSFEEYERYEREYSLWEARNSDLQEEREVPILRPPPLKEVPPFVKKIKNARISSFKMQGTPLLNENINNENNNNENNNESNSDSKNQTNLELKENSLESKIGLEERDVIEENRETTEEKRDMAQEEKDIAGRKREMIEEKKDIAEKKKAMIEEKREMVMEVFKELNELNLSSSPSSSSSSSSPSSSPSISTLKRVTKSSEKNLDKFVQKVDSQQQQSNSKSQLEKSNSPLIVYKTVAELKGEERPRSTRVSSKDTSLIKTLTSNSPPKSNSLSNSLFNSSTISTTLTLNNSNEDSPVFTNRRNSLRKNRESRESRDSGNLSSSSEESASEIEESSHSSNDCKQGEGNFLEEMEQNDSESEEESNLRIFIKTDFIAEPFLTSKYRRSKKERKDSKNSPSTSNTNSPLNTNSPSNANSPLNTNSPSPSYSSPSLSRNVQSLENSTPTFDVQELRKEERGSEKREEEKSVATQTEQERENFKKKLSEKPINSLETRNEKVGGVGVEEFGVGGIDTGGVNVGGGVSLGGVNVGGVSLGGFGAEKDKEKKKKGKKKREKKEEKGVSTSKKNSPKRASTGSTPVDLVNISEFLNNLLMQANYFEREKEEEKEGEQVERKLKRSEEKMVSGETVEYRRRNNFDASLENYPLKLNKGDSEFKTASKKSKKRSNSNESNSLFYKHYSFSSNSSPNTSPSLFKRMEEKSREEKSREEKSREEKKGKKGSSKKRFSTSNSPSSNSPPSASTSPPSNSPPSPSLQKSRLSHTNSSNSSNSSPVLQKKVPTTKMKRSKSEEEKQFEGEEEGNEEERREVKESKQGREEEEGEREAFPGIALQGEEVLKRGKLGAISPKRRTLTLSSNTLKPAYSSSPTLPLSSYAPNTSTNSLHSPNNSLHSRYNSTYSPNTSPSSPSNSNSSPSSPSNLNTSPSSPSNLNSSPSLHRNLSPPSTLKIQPNETNNNSTYKMSTDSSVEGNPKKRMSGYSSSSPIPIRKSSNKNKSKGSVKNESGREGESGRRNENSSEEEEGERFNQIFSGKKERGRREIEKGNEAEVEQSLFVVKKASSANSSPTSPIILPLSRTSKSRTSPIPSRKSSPTEMKITPLTSLKDDNNSPTFSAEQFGQVVSVQVISSGSAGEVNSNSNGSPASVVKDYVSNENSLMAGANSLVGFDGNSSALKN